MTPSGAPPAVDSPSRTVRSEAMALTTMLTVAIIAAAFLAVKWDKLLRKSHREQATIMSETLEEMRLMNFTLVKNLRPQPAAE